MIRDFYSLVLANLDKLYGKSDAKATQSQENQTQAGQTNQSNAMIGSNVDRANELVNQGKQDMNQAGGYYGSLASSGGTAGVNQDIVRQMSGLGGNGGSSGSGSSGGSGGGNGSSGNGQFQLRNFAEADPFNKALASTGGVDMGALTSTLGDYKKLSDNPMDQGRQDLVEGDLGNLRGMGKDDATKSNFLGNGVFKNLSETGGYDDAQKNAFMQQATSTVPAMYQSMADEMARRRAVQGGYAPGFSNSQGLLSRQASQQMSDATRNAKLGLDQTVTGNKLAGAQALSQGQGALSNLQMSGTQAASQGEQSLQDLINNYKMQSLNAQTSENQQAQQISQQGKIAGAGFLTTEGSKLTDQDIAANQAATAASMNSANINAANQRYVLGLENSSQMGGIQGLQSVGGQFLNTGAGYDQLANSGLSSQMGYSTGMFGAKNNTNGQIKDPLQQAGDFAGSIGGMVPGVGGFFGGRGGNGNGMNGTNGQGQMPYYGYGSNQNNPFGMFGGF